MDSKIQVTYCELEESLTEIVRSPEDSYWIIWLNIAELVYQSMPKVSADCLGTLAGGKYDTSECVAAVRDKTDIYQRIMKKYGFGESLDEWGDYWKELVRKEKPFRLKRLWGVLNKLNSVLLPYCYDFISEWEKEQEPDVTYYPKIREKKYREYRSMIKKMQETILVVNDVLRLVGGTEDVL